MKLIATYASRKYDPDIVELVDAWDEFSVDSNYEGWEKSRQAALDSWGDDLLHWVTVEIDVPMGVIYQALSGELSVEATGVTVVVDKPVACPVHQMTDCSPLLNGCSRLTAP